MNANVSWAIEVDGEEVLVVCSTRATRRATITRRHRRWEVRVPARWGRAVAEDIAVRSVREQQARRAARAGTGDGELAVRAKELAERFDLPHPTAITWSSRMVDRWASCTLATGEIRLSESLRHLPAWVVDHVIVHELAHLLEPGHGAAFQALVARDPLGERATGYLMAVAHLGGVDEIDRRW